MKSFEDILKSGRVLVAERDSEGFSGEIFLYAWTGTVVCTWGAGWEHVSVAPRKRHIMPSWDDMCAVKDLFFEEEEAVIQIHPPKSEYINNMPNCLHLWRCAYKDMVLPPSILVGVKKGQTKEEIDEAIKRAYELPLKDIGDAGKECDDRR